MKIEIITHYAEDDEKFMSDYYSVEILVDDKKVLHYGDYYHDKGREKVEGFLDAVTRFFPEFDHNSIIKTDIADGKF